MKYILRHILFCLAAAAGLGAMFMLGCHKENAETDKPAQVASASAAETQSTQPVAQQTAPPPENPAEEAKAISTVIYGQVSALNRRDIQGVLTALDPNDRQVQELTKQELLKNFQTSRVHITLEAAKLETLTADTATVRFTQLTRRVAGSAFRDNRVIGVYSMKKINGAWRILNMKPIDIQFMDGKP